MACQLFPKQRSFLVKTQSSRVKLGTSSDCINFLPVFVSLRSSKCQSQRNGSFPGLKLKRPAISRKKNFFPQTQY